ncbi:MAG: FliG C-terminal domain-containing protein [Pseudobdellovibrio sp.]
MSEVKKYKNLHLAIESMKSLPVEQQKKLILNLIQKDPVLAKQLLENLFEFEDIATLAKADFKRVWFEVAHKTWHVALRGASDKLLLFIRSCLSQRAFDQLLSDLKDLGAQPKSKVLEAQSEVIKEIQSMAKQGRIHIQKK